MIDDFWVFESYWWIPRFDHTSESNSVTISSWIQWAKTNIQNLDHQLLFYDLRRGIEGNNEQLTNLLRLTPNGNTTDFQSETKRKELIMGLATEWLGYPRVYSGYPEMPICESCISGIMLKGEYFFCLSLSLVYRWGYAYFLFFSSYSEQLFFFFFYVQRSESESEFISGPTRLKSFSFKIFLPLHVSLLLLSIIER